MKELINSSCALVQRTTYTIHRKERMKKKSSRNYGNYSIADTSLAPKKILDRHISFVSERTMECAIVKMRQITSDSTKRYVNTLIFDISSAFNNIWWPLIFQENKMLKGCVQNNLDLFRISNVKISLGGLQTSMIYVTGKEKHRNLRVVGIQN